MASKPSTASVRLVSLTVPALAIALFVIALPLAHAQFKVIYTFTGGADGNSPNAGIALDAKRNAYLTTIYGGNLKCDPPLGCGTVVVIGPTGKETVLHAFQGGTDGAFPYGSVIVRKGLLYDATSGGGGASGCFGSGCGTRIKITLKNRKENVTYAFTGGTDGGMPFGGLTLGTGGTFYGTTTFGGDLSCGGSPPGCGTFFKFDATGKLTTLYSFTGSTDGAYPHIRQFGFRQNQQLSLRSNPERW